MNRRAFIAGLGGAVAWPRVARAQPERMRRIAVLGGRSADDLEAEARIAAFVKELQQLGWTEARNLRIDIRRTAGNPDDARKYAAELVELSPDVIFAIGNAIVAPLLQATRTIPIVFATVPDPVGAGFVDSLARPGGNVTGFALAEYSIGAKWLELLKEIAPRIVRVAIIRDPTLVSGAGQFGVIQSAAPSLGVEVTPINVHDAGDIERGVGALSRSSNSGLIVTPNSVTAVHRSLIITLAARYKLPAMFWDRYLATDGGLISYGPNGIDQYRRAAGYVDRILRGEKPADLPVQAPTKYELVINLKTAKALDLDVPHSLLARADEVIE